MKYATALALVFAACASDEGASTSSLSQEPGQCGELETHVFGVYRASGGKVSIHIDRPGRHALVVSAHDATEWTITAGNGAVIEGVLAVGIERQTLLRVPEGAKVDTASTDEGGPSACGYSYPYDGEGCDTDQLLELTGLITLHPATSFHGCRNASQFEMAADMTVTSNCDVPLQQFASCLGPDSCGGPVLL